MMEGMLLYGVRIKCFCLSLYMAVLSPQVKGLEQSKVKGLNSALDKVFVTDSHELLC